MRESGVERQLSTEISRTLSFTDQANTSVIIVLARSHLENLSNACVSSIIDAGKQPMAAQSDGVLYLKYKNTVPSYT